MNFKKKTIFKNPDLQYHFEENGYVTIPLLSTKDIEDLRSVYFDHANIELKDEFNETTRRLDTESNKIISDKIISQFEKNGARFLKNHAIVGGTFFIKRANSENEFPIHQDWNMVDEERFFAALIWCPLQDVNRNNGAITLIPGSNKYFSNTYRSGSIHPPRFPSSVFTEHNIGHVLKTISLKAGEALIYQSGLYHGSQPNKTNNNRLVATGALLSKSANLLYYHWPSEAENILQVIDASNDFYLNEIDLIAEGGLSENAHIIKSIKVKPFYPTTKDLVSKTKAAFGIKTNEPMTNSDISNEQNNPLASGHKKSLWQVYTPANMAREIIHRMGLYPLFFPKTSTGHINEKVSDQPNNVILYKETSAQKVGNFYDCQHHAFLRVYGDVIQAFRTKDVTVLLDQQIQSIGFQKGDIVLDAGCGFCAPAIHFAKSVDISIEAITISQKQCSLASEKISNNGLEKKIRVTKGDYHQLEKYYEEQTFDKVYFLESFGHSHNKKALLKSVWKALKPGGHVYIKDLFKKVSHSPELQKRIDTEIDQINRAYCYQVADLTDFLDIVREEGFIIEFIRTIDLSLAEFEDLAISNEFQELTGIGKIDSWDSYVFPIDFFEVRLMKTQFDLEKGLDRYFLQNLYRVQIEKWEKGNL